MSLCFINKPFIFGFVFDCYLKHTVDQFTVIRYISDQAEKNLLKFNFYQSLDFLKDFRDPQKVAVFLIVLF